MNKMKIPFLPYKCVIESNRSAYYLFNKIDALNLGLDNYSGYNLKAFVSSINPLFMRFENVNHSSNGRFNAVLWASFNDVEKRCRIEIEINSGIFTFISLGLLVCSFIASVFSDKFTASSILLVISFIFLLILADNHAKRKVLKEFERLISSL